MNWNTLENEEALNTIKDASIHQPILIFKHSTRCSISTSALARLERNWKEEEVKALKPYFLDLIAFRSVSNQIQDTFNIQHESPQVLIIRNGKCIYNASHIDINFDDIKKQVN